MCLTVFSCLVAAKIPSVATRVGHVAFFGTGTVPVLRFLDDHVQPQQEVFIYPYSPTYYFLSATTNPTPYSILLYDYNTPSQFDEVVSILEQRKVLYVIWDTTWQFNSASNFSRSLPTKDPNGLIVEPYLKAHYNVIEDHDGILIMERKNDPSAK
jgi:hypothetical protein